MYLKEFRNLQRSYLHRRTNTELRTRVEGQELGNEMDDRLRAVRLSIINPI